MVFSSTLFLFVFLPITLLGYYLIKNLKLKNGWLLFVSFVFFGWSQPHYLWIIILNIVINYLCAMMIDDMDKLRKPVLIVAIIANLAILYYFKYFDFTIDSINKVVDSHFQIKDIVLPIGISFFTFQGMSYVIDVYRKDVQVQKKIYKVALYIVMFPQLIAGPIVRYKDIENEIDNRQLSLENFCYGIERFVIGLGKKAIVANTMAATADAIWNNGSTGNTWIVAWVGSIAYSLQIYYDFSGYSDMAIGLGKMLGFRFNENFNLPYVSKSITEFWRRWHISLSTWFRDYVYIPLGGNRKRVYFNLFVVFLLTGIWHGASWHFVVWGIWNCAFILIERFIHNRKKSKDIEIERKTSVSKSFVSRVYTLLIINMGWILFRAPHTRDAIQYICTMFGIIEPKDVGYNALWYLDRWTLTIMAIGIICSSSLPTKVGTVLKNHIPSRIIIIGKYVLLLLLLYLSMLRIVSGTYNPFIYFQF